MMRIIFMLLLLFVNLFSFAQTTYFNGTPVYDKNTAVRLYSLENYDDHVIVTIEITTLKKCKRIDYWTTQNTFIYSGNTELCGIEGYYRNGQIDKCGYNHQWGWSDVPEGEKLYYKLYFNMTIPSGVTTISIVDKGAPANYDKFAPTVHSYCFYNYTIDNPRKRYSSINSEYLAKKNIDENNDGICGIYDEIGGDHHIKVACVKENGSYKLISLSCDLPWWQPGDIRAYLTPSASGIFKAEWFGYYKTLVDVGHYATFDDVSMTIEIPEFKTQEKYLKLYPTNSSKISGVSSDSYNKEWTGTGFALNNGYIITNNHVVDGAKSIVILGVNGNNEEYKAEVVAVDKNNDLALVKINDSRFNGFNSIPYSVSNRMCEVGEDVFVLGYPLTNYMGDEIKLTNGIISSRSGYQGDVSTYQISAPAQPGNSGGPMFDNKGNVVGIVNAGIPGAENVGYAIKTSYLYNLVGSAVSTSIIPQTNRVTGTSLADKVRMVKKFVFYIKCKG